MSESRAEATFVMVRATTPPLPYTPTPCPPLRTLRGGSETTQQPTSELAVGMGGVHRHGDGGHHDGALPCPTP